MSGAPQLAQRESSGVAHSRQNRASGGFTVRQRGQVIEGCGDSSPSADSRRLPAWLLRVGRVECV